MFFWFEWLFESWKIVLHVCRLYLGTLSKIFVHLSQLLFQDVLESELLESQREFDDHDSIWPGPWKLYFRALSGKSLSVVDDGLLRVVGVERHIHCFSHVIERGGVSFFPFLLEHLNSFSWHFERNQFFFVPLKLFTIEQASNSFQNTNFLLFSSIERFNRVVDEVSQFLF